MSPVERRRLALRRLALICAALVFAVTSLSAFLRLQKAGLGCPDWPACYGQELRSAQQGQAPVTQDGGAATAAARLAHRVAASAALLLVIMMGLVCFASRPVFRREGLSALALLGLALFLAVLGWWSRRASVPAVALGNLLGGFLMLALCLRLARPAALGVRGAARAVLVLAALLLIGQILLGGLTSASYAGLSCTGFGDCGLGEALPQSGWGSLDPWREPVLDGAPGRLANSLHRHAALILGLVLGGVAALVWWCGRRRSAALLLGLLALQLAVGVAMGPLGLPLPLALAHNLLSASLLALLLSLI
jgi:cytochrome c oxidase assembly protein subunit 15